MAREECKRVAETGNVLHFFAAVDYAVEDAMTERFRKQDAKPADTQSKFDNKIESDLEALLPRELCVYLLHITTALRDLSQRFDWCCNNNKVYLTFHE